MGRNNKRVDNGCDFVEAPKSKGTSFLRKQQDREKQSHEKKRSKRLNAYSDSERARSYKKIYDYMNGNYKDEDF